MSRGDPATADTAINFGPVLLGGSVGDGVYGSPAKSVFTAPRNGTVVVVTSVGGAEGSRGGAAALSCAGHPWRMCSTRSRAPCSSHSVYGSPPRVNNEAVCALNAGSATTPA